MRKKIIAAGSAAFMLIILYEGYSEKAYYCPAGKPTIGYGNTVYENGAAVKITDTITQERATQLLKHNLDKTSKEIAGCIGDVPLYQHEFDAYVALAYNIGSSAFCRSTIVRRLKQTPPDYAGACEAIKKWTRAGGRELPGLKKRRDKEYKLCIGEMRQDDTGHRQ